MYGMTGMYRLSQLTPSFAYATSNHGWYTKGSFNPMQTHKFYRLHMNGGVEEFHIINTNENAGVMIRIKFEHLLPSGKKKKVKNDYCYDTNFSVFLNKKTEKLEKMGWQRNDPRFCERSSVHIQASKPISYSSEKLFKNMVVDDIVGVMPSYSDGIRCIAKRCFGVKDDEIQLQLEDGSILDSRKFPLIIKDLAYILERFQFFDGYLYNDNLSRKDLVKIVSSPFVDPTKKPKKNAKIDQKHLVRYVITDMGSCTSPNMDGHPRIHRQSFAGRYEHIRRKMSYIRETVTNLSLAPLQIVSITTTNGWFTDTQFFCDRITQSLQDTFCDFFFNHSQNSLDIVNLGSEIYTDKFARMKFTSNMIPSPEFSEMRIDKVKKDNQGRIVFMGNFTNYPSGAAYPTKYGVNNIIIPRRDDETRRLMTMAPDSEFIGKTIKINCIRSAVLNGVIGYDYK